MAETRCSVDAVVVSTRGHAAALLTLRFKLPMRPAHAASQASFVVLT